MHYLRLQAVMTQSLLLISTFLLIAENIFVSCNDGSHNVSKESWLEQYEYSGNEFNISADNVDDEFTVFMCADSGEYSGAHELGFLYNSLEYRHDVRLDYCHQAAIGLLQHADGHYLKALVVTSGIGYLTAGLCTRSVLRLHVEQYSIDFFDQSTETMHNNFINSSCNTFTDNSKKEANVLKEQQWERTRNLFTKRHNASIDKANSETSSVDDKKHDESNIIKYKSIVYIGTAGFSPWVGGWNPPVKFEQQQQQEEQQRRKSVKVNNSSSYETTNNSHNIKKPYTEYLTASPSPYITLSAYKEHEEMQEKRARRRGRSLLDKLHVNFEHVISQKQLYYDGCSPLVVQPNNNNNIHERVKKHKSVIEDQRELCDLQADTHVSEVNNTITRCNKCKDESVNSTHHEEEKKNAHTIHANANNSVASSTSRKTTEQIYQESLQEPHTKQQGKQEKEHHNHRRVAVGSVCVTAGAFLQESTRCTEDVVYSQCSRLECDDMELSPSTHQTHYLFNSNFANGIIASSRNKEFPSMPEIVRKGLQAYWNANEAMTIVNNNENNSNDKEESDLDAEESVNELKATFVPCVESTMNAISGGAMIDERCRRYTAATLNSYIEREDRNMETHKDSLNNTNYNVYDMHSKYSNNDTVWSADDVVCVQAMEGFGFLYAVKKYAPELPVAIIRTASNYDMYPQQKMYLSQELSQQLLSERMPHLYSKLYKYHEMKNNSPDSVQDIRAYT